MFQDALHFTAFLGCQHLWIDSLCIIQDSEEDKAVEISKMKDIYQGCYLTIAAADAKNCYEGLYISRPCSGIPDLSFKWWEPSRNREFSANLRVEVIHCIDKDGLPDVDDLNSLYLEGPLSQRAWTLQERILPPRVLHFSNSQLVWECHSTTAYEGSTNPAEYSSPRIQMALGRETISPQFDSINEEDRLESNDRNEDDAGQSTEAGDTNENSEMELDAWEDMSWEGDMSEENASEGDVIDDDTGTDYRIEGSGASETELLLPIFREKGIPALLELGTTSRYELYYAWYNILIQYSSRRMTWDQDKIAAIGGIVDLFRQRIGGEVIYGIWKNDLARGLLWVAKGGSHEHTTRTLFPAPSWSWAKIHRQVGFFWNKVWSDDRPWELPYLLQGPYSATINWSQMEDGILVVSALCRTLESYEVGCYSFYDGPDREVYFEFPEECNSHTIYFDSFDYYALSMTHNSSRDSPFLLLQIGEFAPLPLDSPSSVVGLVLLQKNPGGEFERVGVFDVESGPEALSPSVWTPCTVTII